MRATEFDRFTSQIQDVFGTIEVFARVVNDDLMDVENSLMDDPNLDVQAEQERIKSKVVKRIQGVLSEFGLA